MRILTLLIILCNISHFASAIYLDINIYHRYQVTEINFKPVSGKYKLVSDEKEDREILKDETLKISLRNNSISIQINGKDIGLFKEVKLQGKSFINMFSVGNESHQLPKRTYDDHLKVSIKKGKLQLINNIDLERYVSGVVQSEGGGSSKDIEFFFVQAISCRTYALVNYRKHAHEGYNLCDEVHCQHYLGRCKNPNISRAGSRTSGEVIVDTNGEMISAVFHSNCGGETRNSEDIWPLPKSYLKARTDTFCLSMSKARWEKSISKTAFLNGLHKAFNFPINDQTLVDSALHFKQGHRKVHFVNQIPLKLIRQEFELRSSFFETSLQGNNLIITGRGFGHGVGLCQQGAINMVRKGYDYPEIIKYYYKGTKLIHYSELKENFKPLP